MNSIAEYSKHHLGAEFGRGEVIEMHCREKVVFVWSALPPLLLQ
jgi:hypothetical protein